MTSGLSVFAQNPPCQFKQQHFDSLLYKQPDSAYTYIGQMTERKDSNCLTRTLASTLLGNAAWVNGELLLAAQHYLEAIQLMDSAGKTADAISVHVNLGNVFNDLGAYEMAKKEYRYGFAPPHDPYSFLNISTVFIREKQYDSAYYYLYRANSFIAKDNDYGRALIYFNLGEIAYQTEQLDSALYYANKAEIMFKHQQNEKMLWTNELLKAKIWVQQGQSNEALALSKQTLDSASSKGFRELERDIHTFLYQTYKQSGQVHLALKQLELQIQSDNNLRGGSSRDISSIINTYFEQRLQGQQLKDLNQQLRLSTALQSEKVISNTMITIVIVVLMLVFTFIYGQNQKSKRRSLELEIEKDKQEKLRLNLDHMKGLSKQRQNQLHLQEKQLLTHSLREAELNQFFDKILSKLSEVAHNPMNGSVIQMIKQYQKQSDPWSNFKTHFEGIHESFFTSLTSRHKLTGNDLKLSALSVLGFSAKQMADIMGIKASSVDISRHRLRKKLDLEPEQSLTDYLRSYLK